jgi:hypothetical protein
VRGQPITFRTRINHGASGGDARWFDDQSASSARLLRWQLLPAAPDMSRQSATLGEASCGKQDFSPSDESFRIATIHEVGLLAWSQAFFAVLIC